MSTEKNLQLKNAVAEGLARPHKERFGDIIDSDADGFAGPSEIRSTTRQGLEEQRTAGRRA